MNDWDRWRPAVTTFGLFLLFVLLLWMFGLRGFTGTAAGARASFEESDKIWRTTFKGAVEMDAILRDLTAANQALVGDNGRLLARMSHRFVNATVPEAYRARPTSFVIQAHETAMAEYSRRFGNRQVDCSQSMQLGYTPPEEHKLTVEEAEQVLRRFEVLDRVQQLLDGVFAIPDERVDGGSERSLMRIDQLECAANPVEIGAGGGRSFREYRAKVRATMSLAGLLELLRRAGALLPLDAPEGAATPFHALRDFRLEPAMTTGPDGPARRAQGHSRVLPSEVETVRRTEAWFTPYFDVTLELATLEALGETEVVSMPEESRSSRPMGLIHRN